MYNDDNRFSVEKIERFPKSVYPLTLMRSAYIEGSRVGTIEKPRPQRQRPVATATPILIGLITAPVITKRDLSF